MSSSSKIVKRHGLVLVSFVLLVLVFEVLRNDDTPDFFMEKINAFKLDSVLMKEIGGYREFEFQYNINELKGDTLNFEIKIFGKNKNVVSKGHALKGSNGEWGDINDTTYFQEK